MFQSTFWAASVIGASAHTAKLMLVNNSRVIGGDYFSQLLEIDLATQSQRVVNNEIPSEWDFVKGSTMCGGKWYGIGTDFGVGNGIAVVDVSAGKLEGVTKVPGLWYALTCGEQENEVLAVTAVNSPPQFALVKLTLGGEFPVTDVVGEFPDVLWGGWPSIFTFSGNELQAAFPVKGRLDSVAKSGEVYRMDTTTGEVTMHKTLKAGVLQAPGVPYYIKHAGGDTKTTGLFAKEEGSSELKFCDVDFSSDKAAVSNCKQLPVDWWATGHAPVQCGQDPLHYFPSRGALTASYQPILGGNMDSGDLVDAYHLNYPYVYGEEGSDYYVGSHSCATSQMSTLV